MNFHRGSTYNKMGVMDAWSRKTLKLFQFFCIFSKNLQNSVPKVFHRNTDRRVVCKFREIWPTGNRWHRALLRPTLQKKTKFRLALQLFFDTPLIAPKICQGQPPENVEYSHLMLQISSKTVHLRWSYSRTREHWTHTPKSAVKWKQYLSEA